MQRLRDVDGGKDWFTTEGTESKELKGTTDALHGLDTIEAYHVNGKSHDCGSKVGYMIASIECALKCRVKNSIVSCIVFWR